MLCWSSGISLFRGNRTVYFSQLRFPSRYLPIHFRGRCRSVAEKAFNRALDAEHVEDAFIELRLFRMKISQLKVRERAVPIERFADQLAHYLVRRPLWNT